MSETEMARSGAVIRKMQDDLFLVDWGNVHFGTSGKAMLDLAHDLKLYASRSENGIPVASPSTPVSGAQELTRVRAEIYANPTYLAGLLMRIKTAYFEKEWKAVERLFEAEIEEMEKRRPIGAQEFEEWWNKQHGDGRFGRREKESYRAAWNASRAAVPVAKRVGGDANNGTM